MIVWIGIGLALVTIVLVMWMLLTRRLREKYAVMWLVIGLAVLIVGLFPGLLDGLTRALGVQLPSNLLFGTAILLLLGVALHLSWELSLAEDEVRRLAEESAILRLQVESIQARVGLLEDRGQDPESSD
ncbi:DUF2304 domain-containing protein [Microbacterium sp. zg-Y818]|uniref:DUF2304 domain-containing protein n=1 Tax=unclassified Microbacterium TaxID=2609290 RepID=UPI00214B2A44|nr:MULTISPECIES: DUF2304 domain-containing protein [unclassified Microbacterium]MCR2801715.1 DUF2304 domain-containing protein [Microbacterium sp. zg.Y818]WIM23018.1 DUF2304 domain-containing protein [Microbacterium sp. zg-Y818]